jgi:hypothetical protein
MVVKFGGRNSPYPTIDGLYSGWGRHGSTRKCLSTVKRLGGISLLTMVVSKRVVAYGRRARRTTKIEAI